MNKKLFLIALVLFCTAFESKHCFSQNFDWDSDDDGGDYDYDGDGDGDGDGDNDGGDGWTGTADNPYDGYRLVNSYEVHGNHTVGSVRFDASYVQRDYVNDDYGSKLKETEYHNEASKIDRFTRDGPVVDGAYIEPKFSVVFLPEPIHGHTLEYSRPTPDTTPDATPDAPSRPDSSSSNSTADSWGRDSWDRRTTADQPNDFRGSDHQDNSSRNDDHQTCATVNGVVADVVDKNSAKIVSSREQRKADAAILQKWHAGYYNAKDPIDERRCENWHRISGELDSVPCTPYAGHSSFPSLQNNWAARGFPPLVEAFNKYKKFEDFKTFILEEAKKIRQNPEYMRKGISNDVNDFGVVRKYWWAFGLIGSHEDYSLAHKIIFDLEKDLPEIEKRDIENAAMLEKQQQEYAQKRIEGREHIKLELPRLLGNPAAHKELLNSKELVSDPSRSDNALGSPVNRKPFIDELANHEGLFVEDEKNLRSSGYVHYLADYYAQEEAAFEKQTAQADNKQSSKIFVHTGGLLKNRIDALRQAQQNPERTYKDNCVFAYHRSTYHQEFPLLKKITDDDEKESHDNGAQNCLNHEAKLIISAVCAIVQSYSRDPSVYNCRHVIYQMCDIALQQTNPVLAFEMLQVAAHLTNALGALSSKMGRGLKSSDMQVDEYLELAANHLIWPSNETLLDITTHIELAKEKFVQLYLRAFEEYPDKKALLAELAAIQNRRFENPAEVVGRGLRVFQPGQELKSIPTFGQFANAVQLLKELPAEERIEQAAALACFYPAAQLVEYCADQVVRSYDSSGQLRAAIKTGTSQDEKDDGTDDEEPAQRTVDQSSNFDKSPQEPFNQTFHDSIYLRHLASAYSERGNRMHATLYERSYAVVIQARSLACGAAASNPDEVLERKYKLDNNLLSKYPAFANLKSWHGNNAQIRLTDEVHATLVAISHLNQDYGYDICVSNSVPVIAQMNELALTQEDPDAAFNLVEAAHHLASIAKVVATKMKSCAHAIDAIGNVLDAGFDKGCDLYEAHLVELITNPKDTIVNDLVAPFKLAKEAFASAFVVAFGSHEEREELWEKVTGITGHLYKNPEDVVAMGMQFFTPVPTFAMIGSVAKVANVQKIATSIKNSKVATQLEKSAAMQVMQPAAVLVQHGAQAAQKTYATLVEEVYALCKELPTDKNFWRHVFKGELGRKGKPDGFHLENSYPGKLLKELSYPVDERGIYGGFYEVDGYHKFSTFFPKTWNRQVVKEKIIEAFNNPIKKGESIIVGRTTEGIDIKIIFGKEPNSGRLHAISAFPLYKEEEDAMKLVKGLGKENKVYTIK